MKHTRPRRLRNRRPKQLDTRPLAEAARAGQVMADQRVRFAGGNGGGAATGPTNGNMVTVKTSPDFVEYLKNLAIEHDSSPLTGTWIDEAGEIPPAFHWSGKGFGAKQPGTRK